jgi:SAM-dependent methyltransferase
MKNPEQLREREVRERISPQPGDRYYLPLSDILLAVKKVVTPESIAVLDFGAGCSPYRSLFPKSLYQRADIASTGSSRHGEMLGRDEVYPEPDLSISPDGRVPHQSNAFDLVLSTQVFEHVRDTETYLSESFRLLKPGGKLFLTTHGAYQDHGCPYDYRRWTADGLKYDVSKIGFDVLSVEKLTTGPRAMLWFLQMYLSMDSFGRPLADPAYASGPSRKTLLGFCHWLCRLVPVRWIHMQADKLYPDCRVVSSDEPGHEIYVCVSVCAQRPL